MAEEQDTQTPSPQLFDRGAPTVARKSKRSGKLMGAAFFLGCAGLLGVVAVMGLSKKQNQVVPQEEESFRVGGGTGKPYIAPPKKEALSKDVAPVIVKDTEPKTTENQQLAELEAMRRREESQKALKDAEKKMMERFKSPQLIIDGNPGSNTSPPPNGETTGQGVGSSEGDANTKFADSMGADAPKRMKASKIKDISTLVPQGTMIQGVLETSISSNLPGYTRAVVSEDVYSFDGSTLLVPSGTTLIGRYNAATEQGQSRVFIIWQRLLRADGVSLVLDSYGADPLGRSGVQGKVDTHFLERFGSSMMLSLIDAATQAGVNATDDNNGSTVAVNAGKNFSSSAEIALKGSIDIPPTIYINQGERISIFVGHDLDFSSLDTENSHALY